MSPEQVIRDYFSLYAPGDARRHLACHHPEALVLMGDRARPAGTVDPVAFERLQQERLAEETRRLPLTVARCSAVDEQGERAVARVQLELAGDPGTLGVSIALAKVTTGWRLMAIAWDPRRQLGYAQIRALAASDVAYLPPDAARYPTILDLSFERLYRFSPDPIQALPEARFSCHRSGKCCSSPWGVGVGDAAKVAYDHVAWNEIVAVPLPAPFLLAPDRPDQPHRIATGLDGRCLFLEEGACATHTALGTPFNPTCLTFPLSFVVTPDGPVATGSFTCPSVRDNRGAPLSERQGDLRERWWLWQSEATVVGPQVPIKSGRGEVEWSVYRALEARWLELLADEERSLPEVLATGLGALRTLEEGATWNEPAVAVAFDGARELWPPLPEFGGIDLLGAMLYGFLNQYETAAFEQGQQPPELFQYCLQVFLPSAGIRYLADDELIRRYLRQVLWRKRWLAELGLVESFHFLLLSAAFLRCYAEFLAYRAGRPATTPEDVIAGVEALETGCHHSPGFSKLLQADPAIRACLSSPIFADGLLALVQRN